MQKKNRKIYLENTPLEEALDNFFSALKRRGLSQLPGETIKVEDAQDRVTKKPVFARISSPHYHASAMDGVAVRAGDTHGASLRNPKTLKVPQEAVLVDTGAPLPRGKNAVIMIEDINWVGQEKVEILEPTSPWQHVRTIGEDLVASELIVSAGHQLRPVDIGAILAGGITHIEVEPCPEIAIVPTGTELVEPGSELKPGQVIEFNSRVLKGLIEEWGGKAYKEEKLDDEYQQIAQKIEALSTKNDLVIINAGSSAGAHDYTYQAIQKKGEVVTHGVAIRPGKPVVLGIVNDTPVIGVPGYPVSAVLAMELFVKPLLYNWRNQQVPEQEQVQAKISRRVTSSFNAREYLRVKSGKVNGEFVATPLGRGAGMIMSLVHADGMVVIPQMKEGLEKGEGVTVYLNRTRKQVENTVVAIGSHDISLDLLANEFYLNYPPFSLSSAHTGSMGGLMALKRGEAHLSGIHLLDVETGEYNWPYVQKYLAPEDHMMVNLAYRQQGLIVSAANPKGIKSIEDLSREDIRFVNRQKGAGTRMLLDYELSKLDITSDQVFGYDWEEVSHLAVAAAVKGGTADCGIGIQAAANALNLDFIPITMEKYDLVLPRKFWDWEGIQNILRALNSDSFKKAAERLPGYDFSECGEIFTP